MRKVEKERVKHIKVNQKVAKTLRRTEEWLNTQTPHEIPSPDLGLKIVRYLTKRQLQHVLLQPNRFERAFPKCDVPRLAEGELVERQLQLQEEEKRHG